MARTKRIQMRDARKKLGTLWLGLAGISFLIMVARSVLQGFGDKTLDAWGWYLPTIFPTLGLILATFAVDIGGGKLPDPLIGELAVDAYYFRVGWWISIFYLINVLLVLLIPADTIPGHPDPLPLMLQASLWIGPLQGLTAAALGWFFLQVKAQA